MESTGAKPSIDHSRSHLKPAPRAPLGGQCICWRLFMHALTRMKKKVPAIAAIALVPKHGHCPGWR
jgi:hypothetical protein